METKSEFLTLLMNVVGPLVLGLAILYLMLRTRGTSWLQRRRADEATRDLYSATDESRKKREEEDPPV
jgi:hypothetical protein